MASEGQKSNEPVGKDQVMPVVFERDTSPQMKHTLVLLILWLQFSGSV